MTEEMVADFTSEELRASLLEIDSVEFVRLHRLARDICRQLTSEQIASCRAAVEALGFSRITGHMLEDRETDWVPHLARFRALLVLFAALTGTRVDE